MQTDQAVILVAGRGKRLEPLTEHLPKALIFVGGQTLLTRIIQRSVNVGMETFVVVGHLQSDIRAYIEKFHRTECEIVAQSAALATAADGIEAVAHRLHGDFLVAHGDHHFDEDPFPDLVRNHNEGTISLLVQHPGEFGSVGYHNLCSFDESTGDLDLNAGGAGSRKAMEIVDGMMILPAGILPIIAEAKATLPAPVEMRHILTHISNHRLLKMRGVLVRGFWANINDHKAHAMAIKHSLGIL